MAILGDSGYLSNCPLAQLAAAIPYFLTEDNVYLVFVHNIQDFVRQFLEVEFSVLQDDC